ncbi:MAG: beta-ketoacyl synthase N-terminal-like domain-containing protein [Planctomycetota bacterium]
MVGQPTPGTPSIAISGVGLATSLGVGREAAWEALREGAIGLGPYAQIEDPEQAERGGGEVGRTPGVYPNPAEPDEPREPAFLRFAINEALRHAGLPPEKQSDWLVEPSRIGLMLGTTLHGMTAAGRMVRTNSAQPLRDFLAPAVVSRATTHLRLEGFGATTCSACSSGLGSILLGATLLRNDQLDLVIAGGYDPISEYAYAGFNSLRLVDENLPRPFARDRAGMKVSEGYGIAVLERRDRLERRGGKAFLYLRGGGESADAHHLTQPMHDGRGAARAIEGALHQASTTADAIDLVVAHATGTPDNDAAEVAALTSVFDGAMGEVPVVGLKSRLGHTLGAAGAAELIFAGLAIRDQVLPTTATTTADDVDFERFRLAEEPTRPASLHTSVNTSLGFGGANTCVVVSDQPRDNQHAPATPRAVWVTGIGVIAPGAVGNDAFAQHIAEGKTAVTGPVPEDDFLHLLNARRVRRLSDYVKLTLAAATLAFDDAGVSAMDDGERDAFTAECAGLLGTAHGSTHYSYDYYRGIVDEGLTTANPMLFAEGVPNAGAAHLSMSLKLRGACQSIIGSRTAGLDALRLAALRIADGTLDRAVVCAGEEHDELVERCYAELGLPMQTCAAAVTLVLEGEGAARARGARCRGVVEAGAQVNYNRRVSRGVHGLRRILTAEADAGVTHVVNSANGTWLDRVERAALKRVCRQRPITVSSVRGGLAECFSAGPLAVLAATLLNHGPQGPPDESSERVAVLGSDFNGMASVARIWLPSD